MSSFKAEYKQFFESPAGEEYKSWLEEQRMVLYGKAELFPSEAPYIASTAKAYSEILGHIDSIQVGVVKSNRSSSGADA